MKHPNQETLALHAGGDLGPLARWRTERHLAKCPRCQAEVGAYDEVRDILPRLADAQEISWNRLAAEMKANIRLGVAAGECVGGGGRPLRETPWFAGARTLAAVASVVVLVAAGLVLQHPAPRAPLYSGPVVETIHNGIQVKQGSQALGLMHSGAEGVTTLVGADGSMRARFVDPQTGYMTTNNINVD